jgi:hypothetical protein
VLSTRTVGRPPQRVLPLVALLVLALALPLAWYLGSPLLLNQVVDEGAREESPAVELLVQGRFGVVDAIHKGEGTAAIFQRADGQRVLRLDDFRVTNGPDLYVHLSRYPSPRSSAELHTDGAFEVAPLKGNVGSQSYELPADLDLSGFRSAVIYCRRFSTVFSTAELMPGV